MNDSASPPPPSSKLVVVHAGARDAYQVALALEQAGMLEVLVTDLFWPADKPSLRRLVQRFTPRLLPVLERRSRQGLSFGRVQLKFLHGLLSFVLDNLPHVPFSWRRKATRIADSSLGTTAGTLARRTGAGLLTYSYTGYEAIQAFGLPAMLFQAHPHPATIRRILLQELADHPECAVSLQQEWELALPDDDYDHLVEETTMAHSYLAASSFTRASLVEHGVPPHAITVVPYGVDLDRFHPMPGKTIPQEGPLELLFVGRINQRKGITYLLDALRQFDSTQVRLTVCGRVVDDLALFAPFGDQIRLRPSVSGSELVEAYQRAHLFVLPSVAEGFGQVLLEALASGLPILSTTHTAAPDLIENGVQGFIIEPRCTDLLVEKIAWAASSSHRRQLAVMGIEARKCAERFTWEHFREGVVQAACRYLAEADLPALHR